jgi:uncharacterized repeat protein (TIGR01451 family)
MRFVLAIAAILLVGTARAQVGPFSLTPSPATPVGSTTPCPAGATLTIPVPTYFRVADLNVQFRAAHPFRTDMNVWLISPTGTRVNLLTGPYGVQLQNYNVTFDDEAAVVVDTGTHAVNNSLTAAPTPVRSEGNALSTIDGQVAQGNWTLGFCDVYTAADNGTIQFVSLIFTAQPAVLTGNKAAAVYDPATTGRYALPGQDVIYTISVANTGEGPTDTGTIFLADAVPTQIEFWNGDLDAGGPDTNPGTDPIAFSQSAGAGLTFTYGANIRFSTAVAAPANFAACTAIAPTATYRADIRHICISPAGQLAAGNPDPTFAIKFRARIK